MELTNLSKKPLSVPLPGGKKLFLGPGKSGQITRKAAHYSMVLKLIESRFKSYRLGCSYLHRFEIQRPLSYSLRFGRTFERRKLVEKKSTLRRIFEFDSKIFQSLRVIF